MCAIAINVMARRDGERLKKFKTASSKTLGTKADFER
jgi:hypothetical protein